MYKKFAHRIKMFVDREVFKKQVDRSIFYTGGRLNIGDSMVPWLIKRVSNHEYQYSNPLERRGPHLLSIGSILQFATSDCYVWGSGLISKDSRPKQQPKKFSAVRGPLTAKIMESTYRVTINTFGDPALLTPKFIDVSSFDSICSGIGVIPHYVHYEQLSGQLRSDKSIKIIDVRTDDIVAFVREIKSCNVVYSSSLHGIIIAEAFGIPAIWIKLDDRVFGDDFKFHDYYASTDRDSVNPLHVNSDNLLKMLIKEPNYSPNFDIIRQLQSGLISSFPPEFNN